MEDIISERDIYLYGGKARNDFSEIKQNCYDIINKFIGYLQDYCGLGWRGEVVDMYCCKSVRVGSGGGEKHYIFEVNGLLVRGYNEGEELWVDLSFDQFNDINKKDDGVDIEVSYGKKENIDGVQIIEEDSEKRSRYISKSDFIRSEVEDF